MGWVMGEEVHFIGHSISRVRVSLTDRSAGKETCTAVACLVLRYCEDE